MGVLIRYVSLAELGQETLWVEKIDCFRQSWADGTCWRHYSKHPRYTCGLSLVCSDVVVTYTLPDGTELQAGRGDAVLLGRGCHYAVSFQNGGRDTDLYTVNFLLRDGQGNEVQPARGVEVYAGAAVPAGLLAVSELYEAGIVSESPLKKQVLLLRALEVLSAFCRRHSQGLYPIRRGVSLLMREWDQNHKILRYAQESGLSERSFYAMFKKWAGKTPVDYRNELRISAAASMLGSTDLSIAEIAGKTGFEDQYYFSRVFKQFTGISPGKY